MRYQFGTHHASWSQPLHSQYHIGEHPGRLPFIGLEGKHDKWTFSSPTPGQRWRAFLPHLSGIGDDGFLSATTASMAIAKRWSISGSKARAYRPADAITVPDDLVSSLWLRFSTMD
jgi:hypothetical protein